MAAAWSWGTWARAAPARSVQLTKIAIAKTLAATRSPRSGARTPRRVPPALRSEASASRLNGWELWRGSIQLVPLLSHARHFGAEHRAAVLFQLALVAPREPRGGHHVEEREHH